jgi:NTE family protein
MRVGLVLGAGGVVGASWLIGALEAVQSETGWDPSGADMIVGTSAGAVVGALTAEGIPPEYMAAYTAGRTLDAVADTEQRADALAEHVDGTSYRLKAGLPPIGPGSWRMALNTLTHPRRHSPAAMLSGWLPRGFVSTAPISRLVEGFVAGPWPEHPAFWAVAADYGSGHRVAFGRDGAPVARIGEAVAASCAIPGFYHPTSIGGRRYVDGGICSMSNLDLLCGEGLDLVVCLNPTSSLAHAGSWSPSERIGAAIRSASGRRVGHEARKLRECGTEVLLLQPSAEDLGVMGFNMMARGRRLQVTEQAIRSTALRLRELRGTDAVLPGRRRRTAARKTPVKAPRRAA